MSPEPQLSQNGSEPPVGFFPRRYNNAEVTLKDETIFIQQQENYQNSGHRLQRLSLNVLGCVCV